jgi:O-acetylhomoserine (thiol)-lyase
LQTPGFIYSRLGNPTVAVLEEHIATLEGARGATATSTGHAAQILALFPLMSPGDEIIAAHQLYSGSLNQMGNSYKKFGWQAQIVDATDADNFRKALTPKTRAIFVENIANPGGVITDVEAIAVIAHDAGVPLIVDSTMATPYLSRPIEHGADIVVHSTTRFLTDNGTAMGGIIVDSGRSDWLASHKYPSLS